MIQSERILFQDEHLLAVNKLSGELVVAGKGKIEKLPLLDFLKKDFPGLRAVHRLDFETSGVVVFAKTKAAQAAFLDTKFDQWKKIYHTLVMGMMPQNTGAIRIPLPARDKGTVEAETLYNVRERFANSTYVEVEITTGRHHQIRKHFAAIHHPLVLDALYGHKKYNGTFTQEFGYRRFFLHAAVAEFNHPVTGKKIRIEAPVPKQFADVLKKLRALR